MLELPSTDPTRAGKMDTWVFYTFDGVGPFSVTISKELWTEAEFKRQVMILQTERLKWVGKEIKV